MRLGSSGTLGPGWRPMWEASPLNSDVDESTGDSVSGFAVVGGTGGGTGVLAAEFVAGAVHVRVSKGGDVAVLVDSAVGVLVGGRDVAVGSGVAVAVAGGERVEVRWCDVSPAYRHLTAPATASNACDPQVATVPANVAVGTHQVRGMAVGVNPIAPLPCSVTAGGSGDEEPPAAGPSSFAGEALRIRSDSSAKRQADAWQKNRPVAGARAPSSTGRELGTPTEHVGRGFVGKRPGADRCPDGSVRTG